MGILTSFKRVLRVRGAAGRGPVYEYVSERRDQDQDAMAPSSEYPSSEPEWSEQIRKNERTEQYFREWCLELVAERGEVPLTTILNGGAEVHGCSPTTIRRYLDKLTSEFGLLEIKRNTQGRRLSDLP